MHLTVDAGNTNIKYALFESGKLVKADLLSKSDPIGELVRIIHSGAVDKAILSSVRADTPDLEDALRKNTATTVLSNRLRFPFALDYDTPETIGNDRLANAAGAMKHFPEKNVLVVDCGTCITYTLLEKGHLIGGSIAPGIDMRFEALHRFTGKLPLITGAEEPAGLPGKNTRDSIISGVLNAIIGETDSLIHQYCSISEDLNVIITGGNRPFFEMHLKSPIFAVPFLTHEGLHEILLLNP
jgi:type III pantothenate kinase